MIKIYGDCSDTKFYCIKDRRPFVSLRILPLLQTGSSLLPSFQSLPGSPLSWVCLPGVIKVTMNGTAKCHSIERQTEDHSSTSSASLFSRSDTGQLFPKLQEMVKGKCLNQFGHQSSQDNATKDSHKRGRQNCFREW